MERRRKAAVAAAVAGTVLGAGTLGGWLALPQLVRDEVVSRAAARGLRCELVEADVGSSGIVLHGLSLRDEQGFLSATFPEVEIVGGLVALATAGSDAIERIEVRGGDVEIDAQLPPPAPEAGRSSGAAAGETRVRARPEISVRDARVRVRDAHGELFRGVIDASSSSAGTFELVAREVVLGEGAAETASVERVRVEVGEGRLDRLEASGVTLEIASDEPEGDSSLVSRVRALRGEGGSTPAEAADGTAPHAGSPFSWLGAEFQGSVAEMTLRRRSGEGSRDVLSGLSVDVSREGEDGFRTRGAGQPDHGGRLGWDLRIEPVLLRAVGSVELRDVAVAVLEPVLPDALPLHRSEDARLDGELRIEGAGDALHATGRLAIRDLAVATPRIAPEPIAGISLGLEGEATFRPVERRLEIARLRVDSGPAHVDVSGAVEWAPEHYLFDLHAALPPTRCDDAISAIPADLLQEMSAFSLTGTIGGRIDALVDSRDLDATTLTIRVADGCRFESVPALADLSRFEAPFLHRVEEPDGSTFEMTTGPETLAWTPISEISPFLLHAVLGHEDAGFFRHSGFSVGAIRDALVRNLREGRYVVGASTISMQLVKNVFLRREKTLARKVQEVLLTWWIESAWSKERILELYLNVIEYGPGVYGIRAAAEHYFGVAPGDLSPAQSAYLATILPNPKAYHSHWEQGALPSSWANRLARFVRVLGERGRYDAAAVEEGVQEAAALRFHREGDAPPPARTFAGSTSPLPISGRADDAGEIVWDEALDGALVEPYDGADR